MKYLKNFKPLNKQKGFFAIASLVVGAFSAYSAYSAQQDAADAAQQQAAAQAASAAASDRAAKVQAQRERLRQVREARIARSRVISQASQAGIGFSSSGVVGGTSSVSSQVGANIGAINVTQTFAEQASVANQRAATFGSQAQQSMMEAGSWQALSSMAFSAGNQLGGWQKIMGTPVKSAGGK